MSTQNLRTTVYLPKELIEETKKEALRRKTTLTGLVKMGLEVELGIRKKRFKKRKAWGGHDLEFRFKKFRRDMAYE